MGREIKFRAWLPGIGKMTYCHTIEELMGMKIESDQILWLQYTGLKDKNGKEIYEGDVIKSNRGHTAAVEWDDENGRFLAFTATRRIMYVGQVPSVEVIGNIYEKPELMEVPHDTAQ